MSAFKNQSMMRHYRMSHGEKALMRNGEWESYSTVGHVYTVMVEELKINNPDIGKFIKKLNEYIEVGGDGFACVSSPNEFFYSRTVWKLDSMLRAEYPDANVVSIYKILIEAHSGFMKTFFLM